MPEEVVLLCFPATSSDRTKCWSYNGLYSVKLGFVSNIGHYRAGNNLGNYRGKPFVAGGTDSTSHAETETVSIQSGRLEWKIEQTYPFHPL